MAFSTIPTEKAKGKGKRGQQGMALTYAGFRAISVATDFHDSAGFGEKMVIFWAAFFGARFFASWAQGHEIFGDHSNEKGTLVPRRTDLGVAPATRRN